MAVGQKVMPDDHSKLVPLLPIPNRTVKRLSADDSAGSRVKVGHCQALIATNAQLMIQLGVLFFAFNFVELKVAAGTEVTPAPTATKSKPACILVRKMSPVVIE